MELVKINPSGPIKLDKPLLAYVSDYGTSETAGTASVMAWDGNEWDECSLNGGHLMTWHCAYRHPLEDPARYDAIERKQTRRMTNAECWEAQRNGAVISYNGMIDNMHSMCAGNRVSWLSLECHKDLRMADNMAAALRGEWHDCEVEV